MAADMFSLLGDHHMETVCLLCVVPASLYTAISTHRPCGHYQRTAKSLTLLSSCLLALKFYSLLSTATVKF